MKARSKQITDAMMRLMKKYDGVLVVAMFQVDDENAQCSAVIQKGLEPQQYQQAGDMVAEAAHETATMLIMEYVKALTERQLDQLTEDGLFADNPGDELPF